MSLEDQIKVPVECANCGAKTEKSLAWLKRNHSMQCRCGTTINITGDAGKAADAVSKLEKSIKGLGGKLKFR